MSDETIAARSNLRTILLTGLVSLVVGVGSGLLIKYITEKRPKLTYDITTQEVFPGQQNSIGIFAVRIANDGKQEIEQLLCHLQFPEGEITDRSVSGIPDSARNVTGSTRDIEVTVPFLNPGEQFSVHALLAKVSPPLTRPLIDVRGKGALGTEAEPDKDSGRPATGFLAVASTALVTLLTVMLMLTRILQRRLGSREAFKEVLNPTSHHGDQRDVVAFALETKGLPDDAQAIREWPRDLTYWAASDLLCSRWLRGDDRERLRKGLDALDLLVGYASIADDSRRIVSLNMTKLALALEDRGLAMKLLASARKQKDVIIEKRIQADSTLRSMRQGEA